MNELSKYTDEDLKTLVSADIETELKNRGYEYGWHKKQLYAGVIYILVNPAFPALVKIGYADDVEKRVKVLNSNSGLPDPYHCFAVYKVKKRLEDLKLHSLIDTLDSDLRHTSNREFYEMSKEKALSILQAIAEINGDEGLLVCNPFEDAFFKDEKHEEEIHEGPKKRIAKTISPSDIEISITEQNGSVHTTNEAFTTWRQFETNICEAIIQGYGDKEFREYVLSTDTKEFHTKKKNMFGLTTDLMIDFKKLSDGLYLNTNNSRESIFRVVDLLTMKFPRVKYNLVYDKTGGKE